MRKLYFLIFLIFCSIEIFAHTESGVVGGFLSGALHPILGWDHVIAMVAVGLWGSYLGLPAIWLLPVAFPMMMAFGGVLGLLEVPMIGVEFGIAISAFVLGLLVAFKVKVNLIAALSIVSVFAIFHGYAHGLEQPKASSPIAYSAGFMLATGLMHLVGIAFGCLTQYKRGDHFVRSMGVVISLLGLLRIFGVV